MAVEQKRGCGYRKVGGLYMVGGGIRVACDRLPYELTICSCCGQGIKQSRGWTWVDAGKFFQGPHEEIHPPVPVPNVNPIVLPCPDQATFCPLCTNPASLGRIGLLWIGEKFYKTPALFVKEGVEMGFSKRIKAVPQGFKVGETYVMLAHPNTFPAEKNEAGEITRPARAGVFYLWLPSRLEKIVLESTRGTEEIDALEKRGITPVFVPDEDKDHQGNVHDDFANEKHESEGEEN